MLSWPPEASSSTFTHLSTFAVLESKFLFGSQMPLYLKDGLQTQFTLQTLPLRHECMLASRPFYR